MKSKVRFSFVIKLREREVEREERKEKKERREEKWVREEDEEQLEESHVRFRG
jgi:hypothetical protein